jgi:hypothetical protein
MEAARTIFGGKQYTIQEQVITKKKSERKTKQKIYKHRAPCRHNF